MKWYSLGKSLCTLGLVVAGSILTAQSTFANNLDIRISGGSLYIYGDRHDNSVIITSPAPGVIWADPTHGSSKVNGKAEPAVLTGWKGGIFAYGQDGNDYFHIAVSSINGAAHFDLGQGNDILELRPFIDYTEVDFENVFPELLAPLFIRDHLLVIGGNGDDQAYIDDVDVKGHATIDLGAGHDYLNVYGFSWGQSNFQSNVVIVPGTGEDATSIYDSVFNRDLTIDDSSGKACIELDNVEVKQNAFIFSSIHNDSIALYELFVKGLLKILAKDGNDAVSLEYVSADRIETYLGSGDDIYCLLEVCANNVWSYLENGKDLASFSATAFKSHFLYGGAGNDDIVIADSSGNTATIYGEGGTDSLTETSNTIATVKVYTVENRN